MTIRKKLLATIGAMALVATSLGTGGVAMAQEASTTTSITVENTSCVDDTPTTITLVEDHKQLPNRDPQNPAQSIRIATGYMSVNMYVNECLGQGWKVTASMTDFQSGTNVIPSDAHFRVSGYNFSPTGVVRPSSFTQVPGTSVMPWQTWQTFTRDGAGASTSTANVPMITGTTDAFGDMAYFFRQSLSDLPNTIPGGDYVATMTVTFTSDGP